MKIKLIYFIVPLIVFFSCKKEEVIIPDTITTETKYVTESIVIKYQWHEGWTCGGTSDSIVHPSDSVPDSEADYYIDTIKISDTIKVMIYDNAANDVIVSGLLNAIYDEDYKIPFYLDESTNKLNILKISRKIFAYKGDEFSNYMYDDNIEFNIRLTDSQYSTIYYYHGLATKIVK